MIDTRMNALLDYRTSYLVNAKTCSGEAILKLDRDCDGQVPQDAPALVRRVDEGGWAPIKSVQELATLLESTPAAQRGEQLGLWRDARNWFVLPADGKVQDHEVISLAGQKPSAEQWTLRGGMPKTPHADEVWAAENFHSVAEENHREYNVPEWTAYYYTHIDPSKVFLGTVETPAGTVSTLKEGQVVCRTRVEQVTAYARDGQNWVPMGFRDFEFRSE